MLLTYQPTKALTWTPDTEKAFHELRLIISECPTLYFQDPDLPIYVHTDASDYGIGGYSFQIIDGTERPVAFVSKSLVAIAIR